MAGPPKGAGTSLRHTARPIGLRVVVALILLTMALSGVGVVPAASAGPIGHVKVLGWGFDNPSAVAGDAHQLYVANLLGDSVDVLDLSNGSLSTRASTKVRVWYGAQVDARTGELVRVLSGAPYGFESPVGLDVYGDHLFVINELGDSVTDIDLES